MQTEKSCEEVKREETTPQSAGEGGVAAAPSAAESGAATAVPETAPAGVPTPAGGISEEELQALRRKAEERDALWDRLLRAHADFDNWRKRLERESHAAARFALREFVVALLPVLDNLQRALKAAEEGGNAQALLEGVRLVEKQFTQLLAAHEVTPIPALGERFDPELHEVVAVVHNTTQPPFTIVKEVERGYRLHGRVIRPAKVVVVAHPPEGKPGPAPAPAEGEKT